MKKIKLTRNQYVLVDDADYNWLNQWKWYAHLTHQGAKTFYAARASKSVHIYMHRLIIGLRPNDKRMTDHINHNGLDNRRCNLRIVTRSENSRNRRRKIRIYYSEKSKAWQVKIHVGTYKSKRKAIKIWEQSMSKLGLDKYI